MSTKTKEAPRRRRVARPATTPKALAAAKQRRDELLEILRLRGAPVNREQLKRDRDHGTKDQQIAARKEIHRIERGPYASAAARFLDSHDKFAWQEARKAEARHVPVEDLYQAAKIGQLRALDKFDTSRVVDGTVTSFLSYARWWVRCEIGKALDDEALIKVPSTAKKTATDLRGRIIDWAEQIAQAPESLSDDEVAAEFRMPIEKVKFYRYLHLGHEHYDATSIVLDDRDEDGAVQSVVQRLREWQDEVDDDGAVKRRGADVEAAIKKLSPRHRRVLANEYGVEVDAEALSTQLPDGVIAVTAVKKAALGRLRRILDIEAVV